jgi:predicted AAA+ superfamily ATPase
MLSMINRLPRCPNHSFILLGSRGSGKSTWLKQVIKKNFLLIDLLDLKTQRVLMKNPEKLSELIDNRNKNTKWIIIDEIQKIPQLLDTVHSYIEKTNLKFAISGSSARKLRKGAANLLAGRAFELRMYPFSYLELGKKFKLSDRLLWGNLPKTLALKKIEDRIDFLNAYAHLYIKEEIKEEQVVRKLDPFVDFLSVAAQSDTKIINFTNISKDVGVDTATIISYFKILEDTFIGRFLPAYHTSVRKRQR